MNYSKKLTNLLLLLAFALTTFNVTNAQKATKINFEIESPITESNVWDDISILSNLNGTAQVRWQFPNPLRIDHFIVQKSIDNQTFKDAGVILPTFSQYGPTIYRKNLKIRSGKSYYVRVLAITKTGAELPSAIKRIYGFGEQELEINTFPNPATEFMTVSDIHEEADQLIIYDFRGTIKLTKTINTAKDQTNLNLQNLEQGFHQLVITDQSGRVVQRKRILIQ